MNFVKTTVIGGIFFLIPVVVLVIENIEKMGRGSRRVMSTGGN
jgi:hypothetical protein